jgi:hypothetical protein
VPRHCEFYPGICLTTEEKARKNLSQGKKTLSQSTVYILSKHPHISRQYKTTTVKTETNTVHDIPKRNSHNIIKCLQYKITLMYIAPLFTRKHLYSMQSCTFSPHVCGWDGTVSVANTLQVVRPGSLCSSSSIGKTSKTSRHVIRPTYPLPNGCWGLTSGVKLPRRETDCLPPSSVGIKNE